jgi:hypothetical protein
VDNLINTYGKDGDLTIAYGQLLVCARNSSAILLSCADIALNRKWNYLVDVYERGFMNLKCNFMSDQKTGLWACFLSQKP